MKKTAALAIVSIAALATPVWVYVATFGTSLSGEHIRWGEFGSAMSGIYTPILALATLAVLVMQVSLQKQVHKHEKDQAFIQQTRADVEFYVQRLAEVLATNFSQGGPVSEVGEVLLTHFQPPTEAELDDQQLRDLAAKIDKEVPRIYALWSAIQAILAGLSATNQPISQMHYVAALQKLIAMLGFESCVALEHFERVRTQGKLNGGYHFSPVLSKSDEV